MRMPLIVLAHEIPSIVATARGAYDNVNVFATRRTATVPGSYRGLAIEFDWDDRAVCPIVDHAVSSHGLTLRLLKLADRNMMG
jgi:hypothetical protein